MSSVHPAMTGLILAGGAGRRMGRDKARLEVEGEFLLDRVARRIGSVCDPILVASGDGRRLAGLGHREIPDAAPGRGPLAGIVAGLEGAETELVAVVAVDMPFASPEVLRLLAERWDGDDAVIPADADRWHPLHGVYAAAAAAALRDRLERGPYGVHDALEELRVSVAGPDVWGQLDPAGRFLANLNDPDDLTELLPG